jgi:hypothetical protein
MIVPDPVAGGDFARLQVRQTGGGTNPAPVSTPQPRQFNFHPLFECCTLKIPIRTGRYICACLPPTLWYPDYEKTKD